MKLLLPLVWGCTSAGWTYAADVGFEESAVVRRLQDGTMLVHLEFTNTAPASVRFLLFIIIFTLEGDVLFYRAPVAYALLRANHRNAGL